MVEIENPIKVGLHGHGLPDYGGWWKKRLGYRGNENTAKIISDACLNTNMGIYTITDDQFGRRNGKSRFQQVKESAQDLSREKNSTYNYGGLGTCAFIVDRDGDHVTFFRWRKSRYN